MKIISKYMKVCNDHLGNILVPKHCTNLNPSDAPRIHAKPYGVGSRQRKLDFE